ncbi:DUF6000 family protein [Streptomyces sp. NPDC096176]|uniref:DUF6000 family protein n=1 Tax=Streptomyces sp. NPDC096176 TaxID=3366079 RepID=UPI00381E5123
MWPNDDPEILAAVRRYVLPDRRYMKLHGWNITHMSDGRRDAFGRSLAEAARDVTDAELISLLRGDWRASLTAAWLIGMDGRVAFRDLIGRLLLQRSAANPLRGYCFALVRFGTHEDAELLCSFLETSLSPDESVHAQNWALAGLQVLDVRLSTNYADRFLGTDIWARWSGYSHGPEEEKLIRFLCSFGEAYGVSVRCGQAPYGSRIVQEFDEWAPHPLVPPWVLIPEESERGRFDTEVQDCFSGAGIVFRTRPIVVARCEACHALLVNVMLDSGGWVIVHPRLFHSRVVRDVVALPSLDEALLHSH